MTFTVAYDQADGSSVFEGQQCRAYEQASESGLGNCSGAGEIKISCIDGRRITVKTVKQSCAAGYGQGLDQYGHRVILVFGGNNLQHLKKLAVSLASNDSAQSGSARERTIPAAPAAVATQPPPTTQPAYLAYALFLNNRQGIFFTVTEDAQRKQLFFSQLANGSHPQGGLNCRALPTQNKPGGADCAGAGGNMFFECANGFQFSLKYSMEDCSTGYSYGTDRYGAPLVLVFGRLEPANLKQNALEFAGYAEQNSPKQSVAANSVATGSGFFVSRGGLMVTNFHVINGAARIGVVNPQSSKLVPASVVYVDQQNDLAILSISADALPIPLAQSFNLKRGDEVMTLGYPSPELQGSEQKATFGRVNALTGVKDDIRLVQIDVPVQPGNSGGPVLSTNGEVVGVVASTLKGGFQNVNYAVKIDYLWPLLVRSGVNLAAPSQNGPMTFSQIAETFHDSVALIVAYK
ncbi:MAG: serine protease [Deltaproteobacteria bacterium]|nr:serine protease [Deltaproteobacteria bacterium]